MLSLSPLQDNSLPGAQSRSSLLATPRNSPIGQLHKAPLPILTFILRLVLIACLTLMLGCEQNGDPIAVDPFSNVHNIDSLISHYSTLCRQNPNDTIAHFALGMAYLKKNSENFRGLEVQEQLIDSALSEMKKNLLANPNRSDAYFYLGSFDCLAEQVRTSTGFAIWSRFQIKKGRRLILEGIVRDPKNALAYFLMGESFLVPYDQPRLTDAARWFEQAIEIKPHSPEPYMEAGKCYVRLGQYTKAHQAFYQAMKLSRLPPHQSDIDLMVSFYQRDFRSSYPLESCMAEVSYLPAVVRWPFGAGILLFQKSGKEAARQITKMSRDASARSVLPVGMTGNIALLHRSELADELRRTLQKAEDFRRSAEHERFAGGKVGEVLDKFRKEVDRAMHLLSRLDASDPRNKSGISYYQSRILADAGRSAEAFTALKKAAEADPGNVDALRDLAIIYERQGSYKLASDAYGKMRENEGNLETWASAKIAVLRKKSGDLTGALRMFDKVLQDDPDLRDEEFTRGNSFLGRREVELATEAYEIAAGLGSVAARDSLKKLNIKW